MADTTPAGACSAQKVSEWVAEARRRASEGGEDATRLLFDALEEDIRAEIAHDSKAKSGGASASRRLYRDAQRRISDEKTSSSMGSQGRPDANHDVGSASRSRKTQLMGKIESRQREDGHGECEERPEPMGSSVASGVSEMSYGQLLYEEGKLTRADRSKWIEEASLHMSATAMEPCTFRPAINPLSRKMVPRGQAPLSERVQDVLDDRRARRQQLVNVAVGGELLEMRRATRRPAGERTETMDDHHAASVERKQRLRATVEASLRREETFTPHIIRTPKAEARAEPAHERLHALSARRAEKGAESRAGPDASPHDASSRPRTPKVSAKAQQGACSALHADSARRAERAAAVRARAEEGKRQIASASHLSRRSAALARSKGKRELAALFVEIGADEGLTPALLRALLQAPSPRAPLAPS